MKNPKLSGNPSGFIGKKMNNFLENFIWNQNNFISKRGEHNMFWSIIQNTHFWIMKPEYFYCLHCSIGIFVGESPNGFWAKWHWWWQEWGWGVTVKLTYWVAAVKTSEGWATHLHFQTLICMSNFVASIVR